MLFSALGPVGFFVAGCVVAVFLEICGRIMLEQLLCLSSRGLSYLHMIIAITRRSSDTLCVEGLGRVVLVAGSAGSGVGPRGMGHSKTIWASFQATVVLSGLQMTVGLS